MPKFLLLAMYDLEMDVAQLRLSYGRCVASPEFFDDFYDIFQASSPAIRERFVNTDMDKQKELLRHGLSHLIMFAGGSKAAEMKVDHLAHTHDRNHLNIEPWMYKEWLEALKKTVELHDKRLTPELMEMWKLSVQKGIDRMIAGHH